MKNKRGQGLSTNAIVLIILAVVVLVVLVLGFTLGWSKFAPWLSQNNVDEVSQQCEASCATDSEYGFCTAAKVLKAEDLEDDVSGNCNLFATDPMYAAYGISECATINCTPAVCGNGIIEAPEVCDDENVEAGDGCSEVCILEEGYTCDGAPSVCTAE